MFRKKFLTVALFIVSIFLVVIAADSILHGNSLEKSIDNGKLALLDVQEGIVKAGKVTVKIDKSTDDLHWGKNNEHEGQFDVLNHDVLSGMGSGQQIVDSTHDTGQIDKTDTECEPPKIAIIVVNIGLSRERTEAAFNLPTNVTLGITPYAYNTKEIVMHAEAKGHKILMALPLQPENYELQDPGPYSLLNHLSAQENHQRIESLSSYPGMIGFYSYGEDDYVIDGDHAKLLLNYFKSKNLMFIYGGQKGIEALSVADAEIGAKYFVGDVIIDSKVDPNFIRDNLLKLESIARVRGKAIGYLNAYPLSLDELERWTASLHNSPIKLVTINQLFD